MLTIDWKERLNKDTADYLMSKLPNKDYDFEIIFIAYPERVNGKIPHEVIAHVANSIIQGLGKSHEQYLSFFRHLWTKKGDYGRIAYTQMLTKLIPKKPLVYIPMLEEAMRSVGSSEINSMLERVMLPLLRKHPEKYLPYIYTWSKDSYEPLKHQAMNTLVKLVKRVPELTKDIFSHFQHQWYYPLGETMPDHIAMIKTVAKLDPELYLKVISSYENNRDPQIVELICGSVGDYHPDLERIIESWTKSGNARVKKAALTAHRILMRKKA